MYSLRPDQAVGRSFSKNFLILMKCSGDSGTKSDWFCCKNISQKLKKITLNANRAKVIFSFCSTGFINMLMSHAKILAGDKRKV